MITTDRNVFVGAHLTVAEKEGLRALAAKRGKSMSQVIAQLVEDMLISEGMSDSEDDGEDSEPKLRDIPLNFEEETPK